jgi:hypothetical protein
MFNGNDVSGVSQSWDAIDIQSAREGAAALRLQRLAGARVESLGDAQRQAAAMRPDGHRSYYDRMAAVDAFDRLFRGEQPRRRAESTVTNTERQRRLRARRKLMALGIAA